MTGTILVLNVGSSSIKFALYPDGPEAAPGLRGKITGIGTAPQIAVEGRPDAAASFGAMHPDDRQDRLTERLLGFLDRQAGSGPVRAVGHRVVHGGLDFAEPVLVDGQVLHRLAALEPLAPLHQPHNLAAIRAVAESDPGMPQVACFDTAFHLTQPPVARLFALPRVWADRGVLRYGFHGLSYDHIAGCLPDHLADRADGRVVVCHLGNGASLCAMRHRRSLATTMGFTALAHDQPVQRCGALDPGVILHLLREWGLSAAEVEAMLYHDSGLLGVSGISSDMRALEASGEPAAEEAIALFCHRAVRELGGLVAVLGGLDALVFTAGIGENSARIRARICDMLGWLGVALDPAANAANATRIDRAGSGCAVLVIPTDEERVIARATLRLTA